ncbi:DUF3857 domain-containing protein [Pedobacter sp. N36a]|uniref:DUF3857 domain-containing protein n=1 Tax=Pedobacter sp. N36a TaxID=2767996 RepID=UPI001657093C|nr:DUF3857 domain-containing protein [Pedobacter sp. N36a]MBC8986571.1 DUF3857 domain-containing protein [Pedobacter sp. N36a]
MNKLLLLLLMLLTGISSFSQSSYSVDKIPASLKINANSVIRDMETTVEMKGIDQVLISVKKVVTVWNKNGDARAELALHYDKSTSIQRIKGQMLNAFGVLTYKFSQSDFSDESAVSNGSLYVDYRLKYYVPRVFSYPYTIVYEYELRNKQNLILPDWYPNPHPDQSVESNKYVFITKPEDEIRIKENNYPGKAEVLRTEKTKSYTWQLSNQSAMKKEPFAPDPDDYKTSIKIAAKQFSYYGYKGSYQNWEALGKWVYDDLIKNRQQLPESTIQEVKAMVSGINDDREKAKKIYEYVQKKTRYISVQIGIGGFQPMPAAEVQQLAYGDCKALVNYTQTLLKSVGIPSLYCVVNAGSARKDIDLDFASMDQGNHIILAVPLKTDTVWLECTSSESPFGFLGDFTEDRTVFACTPDGGKILRTPKLTTEMNLQRRKASLNIDTLGNITGSLKTIYSGAQYDHDNNLIDLPVSDQLKRLKSSYDIDHISFSDFKISQDKSDTPSTSAAFSFDIQKYAARNQQLFYLELNLFNKSSVVPEVKNRTLKVYINRGYTDEDELTYLLPKDFKLEALPKNKHINSAFGSYSATILLEGRTLIYKRKMILKDGTYPAEQYQDFSTFINDINAADHSRVIYKL